MDLNKASEKAFEIAQKRNQYKFDDRDVARVKWAGVFGTEQEFDHKRYHPTQKPIKLVEWFLTRYAGGGSWLLTYSGEVVAL